jgi:hypothetical protein
MYTFHYDKMQLGDFRSPLDFVKTVVASNSDWEVKKELYSPAPMTGTDRLEQLWIQSTNTTSGQILAMQFKSTYDGALEIAYSRDTDLNAPWDEQPEAPKDSISREGTLISYDFIKTWGRSISPTYTAIVISRDAIHIVWQGGGMDRAGPYRASALYCALDKAHNYLDGVMWVTSHKSGKSYYGIHYNEHWYQEGFGTTNSIEGLQGRLNDMANNRMFEQNYRVHGLYVTPISVHCNVGEDGADSALELAGFVPGGAYGAYYIKYPNMLIKEEINSKQYISLPVYNIPLINTILYPLS